MKKLSFSDALKCLQRGQFVRHSDWRNEFVAYFGAHTIPLDRVASQELSNVLTQAGVTDIADTGNFRKFNADLGEVENGWLPDAYELMSHEWSVYDVADLPRMRRVWELSDALRNRTPSTLECLTRIISRQLDEISVPYEGSHLVGSGHIQLSLKDRPGIVVSVEDRGYVWKVEDAERQEVSLYGAGDVENELRSLWSHLGGGRPAHRTVYTVEILSEEPIPPDMDLSTVLLEAETGAYVGHVDVDTTEVLSPLSAVDELYRLGSQPGFFGLDDEGRSTL